MCVPMAKVMENGNKKKAQVEPGRRRSGRPQLDDNERRVHRIGVPANKREMKAITERAASHRMKPAVFLRHIGLGRKLPRPVPAINSRAYRRLGRMGAYLKQILSNMNLGEHGIITEELAEQMFEELRAVRRLLVLGGEDGN
jgi:hypothetical protein